MCVCVCVCVYFGISGAWVNVLLNLVLGHRMDANVVATSVSLHLYAPLPAPLHSCALGAEYRWTCYQHTREGRLLSKQRNVKSVKYMTRPACCICHVFSIVKILGAIRH